MFVFENFYCVTKGNMACIILGDALLIKWKCCDFAYFSKQNFFFDEKVGIFNAHFQTGIEYSKSVTLPMHSGFTI